MDMYNCDVLSRLNTYISSVRDLGSNPLRDTNVSLSKTLNP